MRTLVLACAVTVAATVLSAGSGAEVAGAAQWRAGRACQPAAYVSVSSGRVRPVYLVTRKVGPPILLPMPGGSRRRYAGLIVITANGKTAYVYNTSNEGRWLTPISTATNRTGVPLPLLDFQAPLMTGTANSKNLYVGGRDLWLINPPASTFAKKITFPHTGQVVRLGLANGGATLYAQSPAQLTPVSTATNTPGTGIALPFSPFGMVITPDGRTAYLTNWNKSTVVPLDLTTGVEGKPIKPIGLQPDQILMTPNGSTIYVESNDSGTVTPVSTKTNKAGKPIKISGPQDMVITPDSKTAWVISGNAIVPIKRRHRQGRQAHPGAGQPLGHRPQIMPAAQDRQRDALALAQQRRQLGDGGDG